MIYNYKKIWNLRVQKIAFKAFKSALFPKFFWTPDAGTTEV